MLGNPCGAPLPVENIIHWAPVAAIPVRISGSRPGVSFIQRPLWFVTLSVYPITPWIGLVPDFIIAPSDFSSIELNPPAILPGVGCPFLISQPSDFALASISFTIWKILSPTSFVAPLLARRCSPPINSVVSPNITVAPKSTSLSATYPITQFEAMPLVASEPPHLIDITMFDTSTGCLWIPEASITSLLAMSVPTWIALLTPPSSCIWIISTGFPVAEISLTILSWSVPSQPRLTIRTAAELGLHPILISVSVTLSKSGGSWQHPWWCKYVTVPITWWQIAAATSLAHVTLGITAT